MKKILRAFVVMLIIVACSDGDEDIQCRVNTVSMISGSATRFSFNDIDGKSQLTTINVHENTDSSYVYNYTYSTGKLSAITLVEDGQSQTSTVTLANDRVEKVSNSEGETRFEYAGDKLAKVKGYSANTSGTLFQVGHTEFNYDASGNLVRSDVYLDLIAIFSLLFGTDPPSYAPAMLANVRYGITNAPNPLEGHLFLDNIDLSLMKFVPSEITVKDSAGKTLSTETYVITTDGNGLPIKAESGKSSMEASYVCK